MPKAPDAPAVFRAYLAELQRNLSSGIAAEETHRHALQDLLESLDSSIQVFNDPKHIAVGAPDFTIRRKGNAIDFPVGWLETKDIGDDLDKWEKHEQLKRYFGLPSLILTDYLEFRWYVDGTLRLSARLADLVKKRLIRQPDGEKQVHELVAAFFAHSLQEVADPRNLALRMARLAHIIRDLILNSFSVETESGSLHKQIQAFRETLIPDLKPEQFADMYAQTIAYGLFAARCQLAGRRDQFSREAAAHLIPRTNPFLRKLFNVIAGPELDERIRPFVDDLVALLRFAHIDSVMADFGKRAAKEDPVVHFYEDFLQAYDPKVREMRGVYYTPEPVVSYIVRSVDYLLRTRFNKPLGLADKDVLILDPACGTGTFLYYVIRHIHNTLLLSGQKGQWNAYVSQSLLKRIFGFELLMAPYAVAHLKLGLLLQELGYKFDSEERLGIFLTNTLEEAIKRTETAFAEWITDEANSAIGIKRDMPIMVVLGNPPYSVSSLNRGTWITGLIELYKEGLDEKKINIDDDYIKFIRFAQWRIETTGYGILAFISNNSYLDGPTHRQMRRSLLGSFSEAFVLDLHGNSNRRETAPDGSPDQNVFDIKQGVAIAIYGKHANQSATSSISHSDLWGPRKAKYAQLVQSSIAETKWEALTPSAPMHFFFPQKEANRNEYELGIPITDLFLTFGSGFNTDRDSLCIDFEEEALARRMATFFSGQYDEAFREAFGLHATSSYDPEGRRKQLSFSKESIRTCLYRPFDFRKVYYQRGFTSRPVYEVMGHMLQPNLGLVAARQSKEPFAVLASRSICTHKIVTVYDRSSLFPLYKYDLSDTDKGFFHEPSITRRHNLSTKVLESVSKRLGLDFNDAPQGSVSSSFGAEDLFAFLYGIYNAASFRTRYSAFLRVAFPRLPLTSSRELFIKILQKGHELISIHLMESAALERPITRYEQPGDHLLEKVRYSEPSSDGKRPGRVFINRTQYFEGVPKEIWEFHIGGYQVCEKWLNDRKGRRLSSDDIDHYQKIVVALSETIRLMREIDELIPGWPLP